MNKLLPLKEVCNRTGLSKVSIWRLEREGNFPKRRQISPGRVGWLNSDINNWIEELPQATGQKELEGGQDERQE